MRYNDRIYINLQTEYTHSALNTWLSYLGEHIHKAFFSIWWYVGISGKPFTRSTTIINLRLKKQFSQLIVFLSQRRIDSWKMDQVVKILLLDYKLCRYSIIPTPTPMSFTPRGGGVANTRGPIAQEVLGRGGSNQVATYLGQSLQVPGRVIPVPKTNASFFKLKLENCKKKMPLILI